MTRLPADAVASPCVRECVIDAVTQFCVGCGRTLEEISYWTRYTDEQRRNIIACLPARCAARQRAAAHCPAPEC